MAELLGLGDKGPGRQLGIGRLGAGSFHRAVSPGEGCREEVFRRPPTEGRSDLLSRQALRAVSTGDIGREASFRKCKAK